MNIIGAANVLAGFSLISFAPETSKLKMGKLAEHQKLITHTYARFNVRRMTILHRIRAASKTCTFH